MSPAHVLEPTYDAIKQRLKNGLWRAGLRLEAARLADELGVSMTPVRDSLWRLAGERMVDFSHGEGFHVPQQSETKLRDGLELNCILLLAALATVPSGAIANEDSPDDHAGRTARIFLDLASRSANDALIASVEGLNDRLHLMRTYDGTIFPEAEAELSQLEECIQGRFPDSNIRDLILRYHHARIHAADRYARLMLAGG